jgi:hypothetical protein
VLGFVYGAGASGLWSMLAFFAMMSTSSSKDTQP